MVDITRVGTALPVEAPQAPSRAPAAPVAAAAPPAAALTADRRQSEAAGKAPAALALVGGGPKVDFAKLLRGFRPGQELDLSAHGFFGSGFVDGFGKVESVGADGFRLDLHVRAPGHDSDKPMAFRQDGDSFVGADGARWDGALSGDGHSLTLTRTNEKGKNEKIQLSVATPGTLTITTWGFGGDNKPLTVAVKK